MEFREGFSLHTIFQEDFLSPKRAPNSQQSVRKAVEPNLRIPKIGRGIVD